MGERKMPCKMDHGEVVFELADSQISNRVRSLNRILVSIIHRQGRRIMLFYEFSRQVVRPEHVFAVVGNGKVRRRVRKKTTRWKSEITNPISCIQSSTH